LKYLSRLVGNSARSFFLAAPPPRVSASTVSSFGGLGQDVDVGGIMGCFGDGGGGVIVLE
jgi:hypothetical protein